MELIAVSNIHDKKETNWCQKVEKEEFSVLILFLENKCTNIVVFNLFF